MASVVGMSEDNRTVDRRQQAFEPLIFKHKIIGSKNINILAQMINDSFIKRYLKIASDPLYQ